MEVLEVFQNFQNFQKRPHMAETLIHQIQLIGTATIIGMLLFGLTVTALSSHRNRRK